MDGDSQPKRAMSPACPTAPTPRSDPGPDTAADTNPGGPDDAAPGTAPGTAPGAAPGTETGGPATALLGPGDPPPFEVIQAEATTPLLLVCDHASRAIPDALGRLGLDRAALDLHIAWDIGAAELTRRLAQRMGATAILAGYSRLVIDCNRQPGDPASIPIESDGIVIPGNMDLSLEQQAARTEALHWPYHHAIETALARLRRIGPEPVLFSIHTFTPTLRGQDRFWDLGVLWNRDPRIAVPLIAMLRRLKGLRVGDNEPYSGRDIAYTIDLHAGTPGLANAAIEIRQDHCESAHELDRWAELLALPLKEILALPHVHRIERF
jgi:predicted N-formylglutamate amidohydrolase